jgi:hypothetical protein
MARAVQTEPAPHQLEPVELPDDGAKVIETSGVEVLDGACCTTASARRPTTTLQTTRARRV